VGNSWDLTDQLPFWFFSSNKGQKKTFIYGKEEHWVAPLQEVSREVQKNEKASRLAAQTPAEKRQEDEALWREWLGKYQERLQQELAGGTTAEQRSVLMNSVNPKIVLRNWVAQVAIDAASKGDYGEVRLSAIASFYTCAAQTHHLLVTRDTNLCNELPALLTWSFKASCEQCNLVKFEAIVAMFHVQKTVDG
jgi:uncharacterized protein YdiU (UPF0061 family)